MAKIKNWSKKELNTNDHKHLWENDDIDGLHLIIKKNKNWDPVSEYSIYLMNTNKPSLVKIKQGFGSKQAYEKAVEWMKNNPEDLPEEVV